MRAAGVGPGLRALAAWGAIAAAPVALLGCGEGPGPDGVRVEVRLTVPEDTPASPPIHLMGDFQGWRPDDPAYRLELRPDRTWAGSFRLPARGADYLYARGDWSRLEKSASGSDRPLRSVTPTRSTVLRDRVAAWADARTEGGTVVGELQRLDCACGGSREALVWLPPGYHRETRCYPLLLLFDGQNVFDARTAFAGEWGVDETLTALIGEGRVEPMVVVAVPHGGAARIHEYTPWPDRGFDPPGGGGADHLRAIVEGLLPEVRRRYRVETAPDRVALAGSSLGGLMSLYGGWSHPDTFGRIAALSPSIWWADRAVVRMVRTRPRPPLDLVYADMGTLESGGLPDLGALGAALEDAGFAPGRDLFVEEIRAGQHDERSWRRRLPAVLERLFPAR